MRDALPMTVGIVAATAVVIAIQAIAAAATAIEYGLIAF